MHKYANPKMDCINNYANPKIDCINMLIQKCDAYIIILIQEYMP